MILQALTAHYETLVRLGRLEPPGWGPVKVSVALSLGDGGEVESAVCVKVEPPRGKKTALVPQVMQLPAPVKRASNVSPNFLCDNATYVLGFDDKGKPDRTRQCFDACKALHLSLLAGVDSPAARALCAFFENWSPGEARAHPALAPCMDDLLAGGNIVFRYDGRYLHENPAVRDAWQRHYDRAEDGPQTVCLVTGARCTPQAVHPAVKGVQGAQSSGAALVSFNAPAFCSYGKEQSLNAPMSQYAAFAYTAALNHLIADFEHTCRIGDATVLFWSADGNSAAQDFLGLSLLGAPSTYAADDIARALRRLCAGESVDWSDSRLDPNVDFYVLGISPNAARLSVRFFLRNTLGDILRHVMAHHERMRIVRPAFDTRQTLSLWETLNETVNQNARDKAASPELAGELLRAVLNDTRYPATLLHGVTLRIRAEREITRGRAAILKAYYTQNPHPDMPKEVLHVSLNPDSTNVPYTLGRLFSTLEAIQTAANPGLNATIKDKYFSSASATPGVVFPTLVNLAQKHLRKLDGGLRVYYDRELTALFDKLQEAYPKQLNLAQQGAFQLGYYHQTQTRYAKKEENAHV